MLRKLLKYDFKSIARILLPIYGACLVVSVLLGAQSGSRSVSPAILSIFIALFTVAIILTIVLVIQRFYQNLLGPEGYLMFTIPASTSTHILEKVLLALVWGLLGSLVIFLASFLILILDPEVGGFNAIFQAMSQPLRLLPRCSTISSCTIGFVSTSSCVTRVTVVTASCMEAIPAVA